MRYDLYGSHKPYGTYEPPFSSTKGYLPSISSVSRLLSIQQYDNSHLITLLMTILPNGKTLAYQSLVNIPPAQLHFPLCVTRRDPDTYNPDFLFRDLLPVVPALSSFNFFIRTSRPNPVKKLCEPSTDAAKRRPTLGGLPPLGPNQDCGRTQP